MKYKLLRFSLLSMLAMLWGTVYAQEPDVTYDFTGTDWTVTEGTLSNGTVSFTGSGPDNFKMNTGYFMLGKAGAYINFPTYESPVSKIVITGRSGASASVKQNIFVGETAVSTETTGATGSNTYEIAEASQAAGTQYTLKVSSKHNTQITKIEVYFAAGGQTDTRTATTVELGEATTTAEVGATIALPTFTVKAGETAIEGATVAWSSTNESVATIEEGQIKALATGTTTIKATFAATDTYKESSASFTLTVTAAPYTSLKQLQENVTSTSTPIKITFNNVVVTAVKGSNAYLADADGYGVLVYTSNHGLEAGQVLNGTINVNLVLYRGQTEITGFTTEGLTITTTELTPTVKTIDAITAANQSTLVTLKNVTYADGKLNDGTNEITYYDTFSTNVTLEENKAYDITGIVILFNTTLEIAPRTAADIAEATGEEPGEEPTISGTFFSADVIATSAQNFASGTTEITSEQATIVGGKMYAISEQDTEKALINKQGSTYYFSMTNNNTYFKVELDNALAVGDVITADGLGGVKNDVEKGLWISTSASRPNEAPKCSGTSTTESIVTNLLNYTIAEGDEYVGAKTIYIYRAAGATEYFGNFKMTRPASVEPEPEPDPDILAEDITATWDFTNATVVEAVTALANTTEPGTIKAVEDNGLLLTVEANGKNIRNNGNSIQTGDGVVFKVPVQSNKDVVTVVGYAAPYFAYSIGGIDATEATTVYTAKTADAAQGYVEIVNKGQYLISIKVEQKSPLQEKPLYSTDFSDWSAIKAATSESTVTKTTKYSKETLTFTLYNTAVMSVTDESKFGAYTELPHMAWQANKAADPYVTTSALASVTKVRFIHGATGSNRGWKLEAKGDGDSDWVVISDAVANPAAWSEVTAEVNRTNVQLRWTNLNSSQNAYMFELDIYGKVDMSKTPALGTFTANGQTYVAGDIFAEQADGTMAATIELSKSETMISAENPISDITADNGEIGTVTYSGNETSCTVTIPVTLGEATLNYVANFVQKADFTLTYYDTNGTVMGTQQVEKDAKIGTFAYDYTTATASEAEEVRGWFAAADGGRKFTTDDVITANTSLYAVKTLVELKSPNARYTFNLADQYFYAEDHEAFEPVGSGKFHDTTHGWVFGNGDKVNLLVGGKANIVLYLCSYSSETAITLNNEAGEEADKIESGKASTDGAIATLKYEGEASTVTLNFNGTCYVHKMIIANQAQPLYTYDEATKTYTVEAGMTDGFLGALDEANSTGNVTIYLPNSTYDLGNECLTTISGENITIKGESQKDVVIQNMPKAEGIGVTATLLNTSNGLTLQNLTLKNEYPYYDPETGKAAASAGRAVCLQDKGNYTVCRNVTMLSYQDTYYSNNSNGQFYFGDCEIHGLVDFVCGGGDVFFEKTLFYLESREVAAGVGDVTIAAPNGAKEFGYVMDSCIVNCNSKTFNWGRSWGSPSKLAWLNTTLKQPSAIVSSRFTAAGMNSAADGFYEYNTMDEQGNVVSPATNVIKFTHSTGNKEYETILTAEEAQNYTKAKVFENTPEAFKERVGLSNVPTGIINAVKSEPQSDVIYNLQGVRVQKAGKGLYIINGKKVVMK